MTLYTLREQFTAIAHEIPGIYIMQNTMVRGGGELAAGEKNRS